MHELLIAALVSEIVAFLALFGAIYLWIADLVPQAEAAASLEALSANREMERSTFLASSSEHS